MNLAIMRCKNSTAAEVLKAAAQFFFFFFAGDLLDLEADPLLLSSKMTYSPLFLPALMASLSNLGVCMDEANDRLEASCDEFRFPSFFNCGGELIGPEE